MADKGMLMRIFKEDRATLFAFALLILISLGLSLSLISWGLPYYLHADEQFVVTNSMRMAQNHFLPVTSIYPPAWFYAHLAMYSSYFVVLKIAGTVFGFSDFADYYHSHQGDFFMISRGLSILASLLILVLAFKFAKKITGDSRAGLLAIFFLVVSPGFLGSATLIKADIVIAFFLALTLYLLMYKNQKNDKGIWLALLSALAASSNYYGALLVPMVIFAFLLRKEKERVIPYLAMFAIFAFILNAVFLLNPTGVEDVSFLFNMTKDRGGELCIPFWEGDQLSNTLYGLGAPLLFAAIGFAYFWRKKNADYSMLGLLASIFVFVLFVISARTPRYSVVIYPLVSVMAAVAVLKLYDYLGEKYRSIAPRLGLAIIVGLLLVPTIQMTYGLVSNEDTRFTSARWINENIPHDSVIAMETYGPTLYGPTYYTFPYAGKDPAGDGNGFYLIKDYYITDVNFSGADYLILSSLASEKAKYLCDQKPLETYRAIRSCPLVRSWSAQPPTFWFHNPAIELYSNCLKTG